jgi:hypothetical protein
LFDAEVVETMPAGPSGSSATPTTTTLQVAIPSRFCSVQASTAGGSITLAQLQEAELQLVTNGGQVQVQRCRATNAAINTSRSPGGDGVISLPGGSIQVGVYGQQQGKAFSCTRTASPFSCGTHDEQCSVIFCLSTKMALSYPGHVLMGNPDEYVKFAGQC